LKGLTDELAALAPLDVLVPEPAGVMEVAVGVVVMPKGVVERGVTVETEEEPDDVELLVVEVVVTVGAMEKPPLVE